MNLDFILFSAPKNKYTRMDFWGQVVFIPVYQKKERSVLSSYLTTIFNCYQPNTHVNNQFTVDGATLESQGLQTTILSIKTESTQDSIEIERYIPCLYLNSMVQSKYLLIYFHSSGQDIKLSYKLLDFLRNSYQVNVLAMEYPGYSLYKGSPDSQKIQQQAEIVYNYFVEKIGFKQNNIIVIGRSIGTGIALHLCKNKNVKALALISAFTNIKSLLSQHVGRIGHFIAKQSYDNISNMQYIQCPVFLLHGQGDKLISYQNSLQLKKKCKTKNILINPVKMTHSSFDFYQDLVDPFRQFLIEIGVDFYQQKMKGPKIPGQLFKFPEDWK